MLIKGGIMADISELTIGASVAIEWNGQWCRGQVCALRRDGLFEGQADDKGNSAPHDRVWVALSGIGIPAGTVTASCQPADVRLDAGPRATGASVTVHNISTK
jgi:hypothetical protein